MREIKVDIEKWIYERGTAYPMIKTIDCGIGESSLGGYFRYEPVVKLNGIYIPVKHEDILGVNDFREVISIKRKEDIYD